MIKHLRAPEPRFFDYASAAAWVAEKARSLAVVLDRSTGRRLDALGLVSGSVEHFSPQSRYGGGYGVVGSVLSGVAVELAAGYTLSEAGACRLWDKSEGEHLDEGGLEFSRVGSTCYLPSTTGLAAGDVIYSAEPVYHDWAELNAMLTAAGSGFDVLAELRNRGTKGLIGGWRWRDGVIVPEGAIDFTLVTASQGATIGSVTGDVLDLSSSTFVVNGGYTLRIWSTTDGALVADVAAGSWTRSGAGIAAGAAVAAAVAALIAGGKSIRCWVEGLSELSIGGASSAIELGAGGLASFSSGLVFPVQSSETKCPLCPVSVGQANLSVRDISVGESDANGVYVGRSSGGQYSVLGYGRLSGAVRMYGLRSTTNVTGSVITDIAQERNLCVSGPPRTGAILYAHTTQVQAQVGGAAYAGDFDLPMVLRLVASGVRVERVVYQ